jgi:hypothetical protein
MNVGKIKLANEHLGGNNKQKTMNNKVGIS